MLFYPLLIANSNKIMSKMSLKIILEFGVSRKMFNGYYLLQKNEYSPATFLHHEGCISVVEKFQAQGAKVKEFFHKKGRLFPYHSHSFQEIVLVKKGHVRLIVEEEIIDLYTGDQIQIEKWAIHLMAFPSEDTHYYYIVYS